MIPVVLLHALGSSARTWETFAAVLPRPSIALDLPGHGTAPHTGDYAFTAMADHVLRAIDGHDTVDLVGHSMGGAVAQYVAMRAPGLVRRMVIEDAAPPPHEPVPLLEPPARPPEPVDFDWAVVEPVFRAVRTPDPAWWAGLADVTAAGNFWGAIPQTPGRGWQAGRPATSTRAASTRPPPRCRPRGSSRSRQGTGSTARHRRRSPPGSCRSWPGNAPVDRGAGGT